MQHFRRESEGRRKCERVTLNEKLFFCQLSAGLRGGSDRKIKNREEIVSLRGSIESERERKTQSKKPFGQRSFVPGRWPSSSRVWGPTPLDPAPALKTKATFRTRAKQRQKPQAAKTISLQRSEDRENSSATNSNIRLSAAHFCILNYRGEKFLKFGERGESGR